MNLDSEKNCDLAEKILSIMLETSEEHPISRRKLMAELGIRLYSSEDRTARKIYHEVLQVEYPLSSNSHSGYWYSHTKEGMEKAYAELISRGRANFKSAENLKNSFWKRNKNIVLQQEFTVNA